MRSRPQQLTMCRSLHAEALQTNVREGLAHGSSKDMENVKRDRENLENMVDD